MKIEVYVDGTPYETLPFEVMPRTGEFVDLPGFGRTVVAGVLHTPMHTDFQAQISLTTAKLSSE
ncbi:MAG: hypothetical protein AAGF71_02750 [Pseudomonadota bacterium]